MSDETEVLDFTRSPHLAGITSRLPKEKEVAGDSAEESCPAYGYLRGLRERAIAVEFRFRDGNSDWFSYSHLSGFRFNPSAGVLLKFTGDLVSLVLIRGSNLDALVGQGMVNLTDRGFQRHRIMWVREMDEDDLRKVGMAGPTVDRIDVAEFESHSEVNAWLKKVAPVFVRQE